MLYIIDDLLTPLTESNVTDLGSGSHTPSTNERISEYVYTINNMNLLGALASTCINLAVTVLDSIWISYRLPLST